MALRLGTRGSRLALTQTHEIANALRGLHPGLEVDVVIVQTTGDKILDSPLSQIGGKGVFTKEIEEALYDKRIDVAVHSLKDVPTVQPPGLALAAITERHNPGDYLISARPLDWRKLGQAQRIGTSSLRRQAQIRRLNRDVQVLDLRGNVPTRVRKMLDGMYEAIVVAAAGVDRLEQEAPSIHQIPYDEMLPAPAQGALGLQTRGDDEETRQALAPLHDGMTAACCLAERALLQGLGGGCQLPLGTLAAIQDGRLLLRGRMGSLDGRKSAEGELSGDAADPESVGRELAEKLLVEGGLEILKELDLSPEEGFEAAVRASREMDQRPLGSRRVLVTRDEDADGPLSIALRQRGAQPICLPLIRHEAAEDDTPLREALARLDEYDWLILTSRRATSALLRVWQKGPEPLRNLAPRIACVGAATARSAEAEGGRVELIAPDTTAESLVEAFQKAGIAPGTSFLYPRSSLARPGLAESLREMGARVDDPVAYRTVRLESMAVVREALAADKPDAVLFCSSSAVEALEGEDPAKLFSGVAVGSMGPRTSESLRAIGLPPHFETDDRTFEGLVDALQNHLSG